MQQDEIVASYLRDNPGFLASHPRLYEVLTPPRRVHGPAVADHMDAMVRTARSRAEEVTRDAAAAAADRRAADGFVRRVQDAVLALMRAPDPLLVVAHELAGILGLDAARVCSEVPRDGAATVPRGTVANVLGQRRAIVRAANADAMLHGEAVALAGNEALVRIPLAVAPALLALACRDGTGLLGATTDTLAFLGHALGAAMERA